MTKTKLKGLTAEMRRENKEQAQTRWILIKGVPYLYRKLYEKGSNTMGLIRDSEGRAARLVRVEHAPKGTDKRPDQNVVIIDSRSFEFFTIKGGSDKYLGLLKSVARGFLFAIVRAPDFDKKGGEGAN